MTIWEISQTAQDKKQLKIPTGHISPFALLFKWRKKTNKQRNHSQSKRWNLPRGEVTTWSGVLENNQNKKQKQNPLNNNNSHCVWTLFPRLETVIKVKGEKLSSVDDHHADIPHKAADYSNTQHTKLFFFFCFFFFLKNGDDVIKALMHHPQVYNKCGPCAEYHPTCFFFLAFNRHVWPSCIFSHNITERRSNTHWWKVQTSN